MNEQEAADMISSWASRLEMRGAGDEIISVSFYNQNFEYQICTRGAG